MVTKKVAFAGMDAKTTSFRPSCGSFLATCSADPCLPSPMASQRRMSMFPDAPSTVSPEKGKPPAKSLDDKRRRLVRNVLVPEISAELVRELCALRIDGPHHPRFVQRRSSEATAVASMSVVSRSLSEERAGSDPASSSPRHSDLSSTPINTLSTNSLSDPTPDLVSESANDSPTSDEVVVNMFYQLKTVSISLSLIVEHVLFAAAGGRVWVAGWTRRIEETGYKNVFSFGDELVKVGNITVKGMDDLPEIFYVSQRDGMEPINLVLRVVPFGKFICLRKPICKTKSLGIVLHKHKNRIETIEEDSIAAVRGVPSFMKSAFRKGQTFCVISEVAGRRLDPFARDDAFLRRLTEVLPGEEFWIVLHPNDMVKEMKASVVASKKPYKPFHVK